MKNRWRLFLILIVFSSSLASCKIINAPIYIKCFDNSKGSPDMDEALERLWRNHSENRVDLQTLKSLARINPKLLENGEALSTLNSEVDSSAKEQMEYKYFRGESLTDKYSYRRFKSQDNELIYSLKYRNCKSRDKVEGKASCATCLDAIMYLPTGDNTSWKSFFDLKPSERNRIRKLFKNDIMVKLQ